MRRVRPTQKPRRLKFRAQVQDDFDKLFSALRSIVHFIAKRRVRFDSINAALVGYETKAPAMLC